MAVIGVIGRRREGRRESTAAALTGLVQGLTPEELYRTQPHLRAVVSFVARNIAHLGVKVYERDDNGGRTRLHDDPLSLLLKRPNGQHTTFELIEALVSDLCLYDAAYWLVAESSTPSGWTILPLSPTWIKERTTEPDPAVPIFDRITSYTVQLPDAGRVEVPAEHVIPFHGWNPGKPLDGASKVDTLKQILGEQVQAWAHRLQVWENGPRVGAVINRPKGAKWSDAARERFVKEWAAQWSGDGKKAGGTLILEDGMTLESAGFSAHESEWAEVAKLALSTVAAVYHVNPVMVGILDNANMSNTREFRKMLYTDTLGPLIAMIEDRLNTFLAPRVATRPDAYAEFLIEEKLQGDFEEQAAILSKATGAPWMTVNEVRALRNLPTVDNGDGLAVPLNVLIGGQSSPRDTHSNQP